jgi:hypothetical protein
MSNIAMARQHNLVGWAGKLKNKWALSQFFSPNVKFKPITSGYLCTCITWLQIHIVYQCLFNKNCLIKKKNSSCTFSKSGNIISCPA